MNATQTIDEESFEQKRSVRAILGDFLGEGLVGIATVILAIIGLSEFSYTVVPSIATIVIGIAFLLEAGAVSMRFPTFLAEKRKEIQDESLGVGNAAEFIGGIVGILLGVLSIVGLSQIVLVSVAVIVYGFTLVLSSSAILRANILSADERTQRVKPNFAREAVSTAANFEFLFGLSVAVLGIIAISGSMIAGTLNLAALLILGVSGFLTAAAVTARMGRVYRR
jgi:hypothetical protein